MATYTYKLTEEIARWAFEIKCKQSADLWFIAFTNPTAGPWKTIKCTNVDGIIGEVYRFTLEETRPDIILVNDYLRTIIIIEAKDSLNKLIIGNQVKKSIKVMINLSEILSKSKSSQYWNKRSEYTTITGLLWGSETNTTSTQRDNMFDKYYDEIREHPQLDSRLIIGIETTKRIDKSLVCNMHYKAYEVKGSETISPTAIAHSLGLNLTNI